MSWDLGFMSGGYPFVLPSGARLVRLAISRKIPGQWQTIPVYRIKAVARPA